MAWLEAAFGIEERVRIGESHRAQLRVGTDGAVVVAEVGRDRVAPSGSVATHLIKVRVPDVDASFARARDCGAHVVEELTTYEYGERSGVLEDPAGHRWELTQTLRDCAPEECGWSHDRSLVRRPTTAGRAHERGVRAWSCRARLAAAWRSRPVGVAAPGPGEQHASADRRTDASGRPRGDGALASDARWIGDRDRNILVAGVSLASVPTPTDQRAPELFRSSRALLSSTGLPAPRLVETPGRLELPYTRFAGARLASRPRCQAGRGDREAAPPGGSSWTSSRCSFSSRRARARSSYGSNSFTSASRNTRSAAMSVSSLWSEFSR